MTIWQPPPEVTLMFDGQAVMVGAWVSLTVTVNEQLVSGLSGLLSLAVQFTVVVPNGNVEPLAGLQTMVEPGQLSDAVAV